MKLRHESLMSTRTVGSHDVKSTRKDMTHSVFPQDIDTELYKLLGETLVLKTRRDSSMSNSDLCCKAESWRMQSEEWRVED